MADGLLIILSAPSGAGKSTLVQALRAADPKLGYSISATTRAPRGAEVDGRDYHFLPEAEFRARIDRGEFLEWAKVHNNYYGTLRSELRRNWDAGLDVLLDIDVQGAMQVREKNVGGLFVFIAPPSLAVLEQRLRDRGTDAEDVIQLRLRNATRELDYQPRYDRVIVNDTVARAVAELQAVIADARARRGRQGG